MIYVVISLVDVYNSNLFDYSLCIYIKLLLFDLMKIKPASQGTFSFFVEVAVL